MSTWVWAIDYEQDGAFVVLQKIPTRYEALSAVVGWVYSAGIPGTFNLCNNLFPWLEAKAETVYRFPITKQALETIDPSWLETESERDSNES